jgi:hypothetical protein
MSSTRRSSAEALSLRSAHRLSFVVLVAVSGTALFACSALVGYDDLQKTAKSAEDGGDGREGGDIGTDGGSDPGDSGGTADAGPRCSVDQPFGAPQLLAELDGDKNTSRGKFTPDEREAFYSMSTSVSSPSVLRHAKRASIGAPWTIETLTFNPAGLGIAAVTVGGLKLYYHAAGGLHVVSRPERNSPFGAATAIDSDDQQFFAVHIVDSDDFAYYDKPKAGAGSEIGLFLAPVLISGISSAAPVPNLDLPGVDDWDPILNANQTSIIFASGPDSPSVQTMVARRATKQAPFGAPIRVPELEGPANDHVSWVSNDECVVLLQRSSHVFMAQRGR